MRFNIKASAIPAVVEKIAARTPVTSGMNTRNWSDVPLGLRERALFSAKVESARLLSEMKTKLHGAVDGGFVDQPDGQGGTVRVLMDKGRFISDMRKTALDLGLGPTGPRRVEDITTDTRLGLIYDQNVQAAYGYADRKVGLDPDLIDEFPAQRLVRIESRGIERGMKLRRGVLVPDPENGWPARWARAGEAVAWKGALQDQPIALKTSPIWTALSAFGTPWPPFDFGSGMGVEDVDRAEAERLGLVDKGQILGADAQRAEDSFNAHLEASVRNIDSDNRWLLKDSFGDQVKIIAGRAAWHPQAYREYYEHANNNPQWNPDPFRIGKVTTEAVKATSKTHGAGRLELTGLDIRSPSGLLRHADDSHGMKSRETAKSIPMTPADFERVPGICRFPSGAEYNGVKNTVTLKGKAADGNIIRVVLKKGDGQTAVVQSVYKRKT
ncbi:MAG: hypothetical protein KBC05_19015 [Candidatus Hydrogenedentes bacterium]|nr:hypothetical protein [Candidatus Hydrogenedentota bacterium]